MTSSKSSTSDWRAYADSTSSTVTVLPGTELRSYDSSGKRSESQKWLLDKNPTTRRYPRTIEEAFPNSVELANWWYPPEKRKMTVIQMLTWCSGISMWISIAYLFAKN